MPGLSRGRVRVRVRVGVGVGVGVGRGTWDVGRGTSAGHDVGYTTSGRPEYVQRNGLARRRLK
jgi:hypothetical protein